VNLVQYLIISYLYHIFNITGGNQAEYFRNRKSYFSLNVQTICDSNLKILDIVARWPGSTHDTSVFNGSAIKARLENGDMGDSLIVGDGGYPTLPYLITPLREPVGVAENRFNESQIRTRNPVERMYGVWKRRFPILSLGMRCSLDLVMAIIVATAVLQNIACDMHEDEPPKDPDNNINEDDDDDEDQMPVVPDGNGAAGNDRVRQALIHEYFARYYV
jgi:nuclease HARBI1